MIFESKSLKVHLRDDGIADLCFDGPGSVNKLDLATLQELDSALDHIKASPDPVRGLLLRSAKDNFIVGADINEFLDLFDLPEAELSGWLMKANHIFCKLEDLPFPTLSAIRGFALGGGMELILATDFRVLDHSAQIGLPETKLGIMPGFGGTVRLPRVIGTDNALEWITTGKTHKASAALAVSAVDAIVESSHLIGASVGMLLDADKGLLDWQARRQAKLKPIPLTGVEALMSFSTAKAMVIAKVGPHYPAPIMAVQTIELAADMEREAALAKELEGFIHLAKSHTAQALVGIYLGDQHLKSLAKKAARLSHPIHQGAVLGAGIMGGGIAYQGASRGMAMVMKDIQPEALELGLAEASQLLEHQLQRGRLTPRNMADVLNRIVPTLDYTSLAQVDAVVEAVVENPQVKATVLAEVESHVGKDCVISSNTSTISIDQLAGALKDPSRFCGMHFFNPVHRMPLVEVIRGKHTSDETIATVVNWAVQMGKSPVVVNDCPGFFVNRVLFPYFKGFTQLINDGVSFEYIDRVMEYQFGWPMGPAYLLDVVGIDTAHHARTVMADGFPERMSILPGDAIEQLYAEDRYGQKTGKGFYLYGKDNKGRLEKHSCEQSRMMLIKDSPTPLEDETIIARMMIPMVLETIRCLEENVIASPAEADMALVYGLGFPPFRGGVFRYLEAFGLEAFIQLADSFVHHLGPLYQATSTMREMAAQGRDYLTPPSSHQGG